MKVAIVLLALLSVGFCIRNIHSPLDQDREVSMHGDIAQYVEDFSPSNVRNLNLPTGTNDVPMCKPGHPDYFKFLGVTVATLSETNPTAVYETPCFKETRYTVQWVDSLTAKIIFASSGKKNLFCADHYVATTLISFDIHTNWMWLTNSVTYRFKSQQEAEYARTSGINVILMCDSWLNMIPDMIKTISLYIPDILYKKGINNPIINAYFYRQARNFLIKYTGATFEPRKEQVKITEEYIRQYIKSGDILVLDGQSGLGSFIFYNTGGPVVHAAIAMWDDQIEDKLWIIEANGRGLIRLELEDWFKEYDREAVVGWLHLSEENRAKFNPSKAWEWFRSVENLSYGLPNFIFTVIDDPAHNFDYITDLNSFILMFRQLDMLAPGFTDLILNSALNNRLGTSGLDLTGILYEAQRQGTTLADLMKIPEKDGWLYNGDQSFVCSCLAIKMLQEGGLMAGLDINSHEFSPRDVFMLQIYESDPSKMPALCQQNDPGLPFCQLLGDFKLSPKLYNTIAPYSHMNENCPSLPPVFFRPSTC